MRKLMFSLAVLSVVMTVSCKKDEEDNHPQKYVGTWELESVSITERNYWKDETGEGSSLIRTVSEEQFEEGNAPLLILNADGSYEQKQEGEGTVSGVWKVHNMKGTTFTTVRDKTGDKADFDVSFISDNKILLSIWISEPADIRLEEFYIYNRK